MIICNDFASPDFLDGLKGIAFDCDGVLFDSWEANKAYYNGILAGIGAGPMDGEQEDFVHAHAVKESLLHIAPAGREDEAFEVARNTDYKTVLPYMTPEPGLEQVLAAIRESGLRIGLFTNRTTTMETILDIFGLEHFFYPVMTAGKVPAKPNPEGLRKILDAWGCKPDEMAFVGDTSLDAQAAHAAGVRFWSFKTAGLPADVHLPDFWSLKRQLGRWTAEQE